jgi:hypothetical protein
MSIDFTEVEIDHLLTLLRDAKSEGSYYGRRDHYLKRHERIRAKLLRSAAPPERVSEGKEAFDWRKAQDKYNETVRHVVNELGLAELLAALDALIIDANRLCDRQLGGSYEDDCRRSIEAAKLARRAARPAVEPREEPR